MTRIPRTPFRPDMGGGSFMDQITIGHFKIIEIYICLEKTEALMAKC